MMWGNLQLWQRIGQQCHQRGQHQRGPMDGHIGVVFIFEVLLLGLFKFLRLSSNGIKFHQGLIYTITNSLAGNIAQCHQLSTNQRPILDFTHTENRHTVRPCSWSSSCKI